MAQPNHEDEGYPRHQSQPHQRMSDQREQQNGSQPRLGSQGPSYPWLRHSEWMNQIQPIQPDQFPRAHAPIVYEGFMPNDGVTQSHAVSPSLQTSIQQFPWPAQKEPPPIKPMKVLPTHHFSRNVHLTRLASPAYQIPVLDHDLQHLRQDSPSQARYPMNEQVHSWQRSIRSSPAPHILRNDRAQSSHYPPLAISAYSQINRQQSQGPIRSVSNNNGPSSDSYLTSRTLPTAPTIDYISEHGISDFDGDDDAMYDTEAYDNTDHENARIERSVPSLVNLDNVTGTETTPTTPKVRGRVRRNRTGTRGRPRRNSKDKRGGTREALDPGEEFNNLHSQATEALIVRQDLDTALRLILQAISINPEIISAHVMLSEIYLAQGDNEKAIAALFSGAHAAPNNAAVWSQVADICLQRSTADRTIVLKQAAYCFSRLLNMDQEDHEARFQRAVINRELGYSTKALKDLDIILKVMPYNASILKEYAEVCLDIDKVERVKEFYDSILEQVQSGAILDSEAFTWAHLIVYVDLVSHEEGVAEAISVLNRTGRWLAGRVNEHFWDTIVEDDREWDMDHVPRRMAKSEFQIGQYPIEAYGASLPLELRMKLAELRLMQGNYDEALAHYEWLEPEAMDEGASVHEYPDLFLQAAHSLREAKQYRQALRYYNALLNIQAEFEGDDALKFWLGVAACSYVCDQKQSALQYYENAKVIDPENVEAHTQLSKLHADKGQRDAALKLARDALAFHERALPKTGNRKYERKELREARQAAQAAYKAAYRIPKAPGDKGKAPAPSFSRRKREKARRAEREEREERDKQETERVPDDRPVQRPSQPKKRGTKKQRSYLQQEQHIHQLYSLLCSKTETMRDDDEEARSVWLECAESLMEDFRSNRIFYPAERYKTFQGYDKPHFRKTDNVESSQNGNVQINPAEQEDIPVPSIESNIPSDYRGISFSSWLDLFLEYALVLANMQYEPSECYSVITAASDCVVWYHDADAMVQIHICYVACCLALQDETTLFNVALRWFMREYAYCTDAYRLFSALNFYYPHPPDRAGRLGQMTNAKFRANANQKFMFRHIVALDSHLPEDYGVDTPYGPVPEFARREQNDMKSMQIAHTERTSTLNRVEGTRSRFISSSVDATLASTPDATSEHGNARYSQSANIRISNGTFQPQEMDVILLTIYGQTLYAANSFPSALSYLYRAHSLDPKNPVVLLSIALCYIHQMFKRQNENRHMYLLQGWALFEEYATVRMEWALSKRSQGNMSGLVETVKREIEFNRSRCWQMLGLADLAIRGYEKMMNVKTIKTEQDDEMDVDDYEQPENEYDMEAAYALATMYAINGDTQSAKEITEKWLVVE